MAGPFSSLRVSDLSAPEPDVEPLSVLLLTPSLSPVHGSTLHAEWGLMTFGSASPPVSSQKVTVLTLVAARRRGPAKAGGCDASACGSGWLNSGMFDATDWYPRVESARGLSGTRSSSEGLQQQQTRQPIFRLLNASISQNLMPQRKANALTISPRKETAVDTVQRSFSREHLRGEIHAGRVLLARRPRDLCSCWPQGILRRCQR